MRRCRAQNRSLLYNPKVKRVVLYFPQQVDQARGLRLARHILPLPLLAVAGGPARDGFEVVIIDGNLLPQAEAHRRVVEACEGALLYATTGILSYQVTDALSCTRKVKGRFPKLPAFIGGWFASALPEPQLETGLYEAVVLGQGEVTFRELVAAVDAGEPFDGAAGLALRRDGRLVRTTPRPVVGWDELPDTPWQLIDFPSYAALQRAPGHGKSVEALPPPPGYSRGRPFAGLSYFSSFGCPLDCTFCCSPLTAGRRWKAMSAERMLDEVQELQERWGFEVLHFWDANWGVSEERVRAFAAGLLERDLHLFFHAYFQSESVVSWAPDTLDLLAEAGLYATVIGAETGTEETMRSLHKPTRGETNLAAVGELHRRGISTCATFMIGFPGESRESMLATLDQGRRLTVAFPLAAASIWPYHPIPGSAMYADALRAGFQPPDRLEEWGKFFDFRRDQEPGWIPGDVARLHRLYKHFSTLSNGIARSRVGWWERRAHRRLLDAEGFRRGWPGGLLEARGFQLYRRVERSLPRWLRPHGGEVERGWKTRLGEFGPEYPEGLGYREGPEPRDASQREEATVKWWLLATIDIVRGRNPRTQRVVKIVLG